MGACFCTGRCRETGVCPNTWDWQEGDRAAAQGKVKLPPTNSIRDRVFSEVSQGQRIERLEDKARLQERLIENQRRALHVLRDALQAIYAHPAATHPVLALASEALRATEYPVPQRWALDH
jgi:hypothetical protein